MKLEFYSLEDLQEFLDWACPDLREATRPVSYSTEPEAGEEAPASPGASDEPNAVAATGEPLKRKRRTKAEMEAARAAEAAAAPATVAAGPGDVQIPAPIWAPPTGVSVMAATSIPAETIVATVSASPDGTAAPSPVDHLNVARAFIGKHGVGKYTESQTLAGLGQDVMAYSVGDRAKHIAMMKALGG